MAEKMTPEEMRAHPYYFNGRVFDGKLSAEDKQWLLSWNQEELIQRNEDEFGVGSDAKPPSQDLRVAVSDATVSELERLRAENANLRAQLEGPSSTEDEDEDDYDAWNMTELRAEAKSRQVAGYSNMKQDELVAALRKWDADNA
jgi:hypothetical protein